MRALILIASATLALGGCGGNDRNDNVQAVDDLTAENIVSNDVTAIDAVTGDAANMAADVDLNFGNLASGDDANGVAANTSAPTSTPTRKRPRVEPVSPAPEPVINSAANSE